MSSIAPISEPTVLETPVALDLVVYPLSAVRNGRVYTSGVGRAGDHPGPIQ
ncbi:hypothetical protein [Natronorubrum sp. DTA7]|uniref:hypothetical protein n=1 Tax=Natronorubrum sp. DTA7 TaxID=3447016 RepID=UPI003F832EA5